MVNPVLTLIFDLFLIGSAISVVAAMVVEYRTGRSPAIGRAQSAYRSRVTRDSAVVARRSRRASRLRAA